MTPNNRMPALPSALAGSPERARPRLEAPYIDVPPTLEAHLHDVGVDLERDPVVLNESARDWWPLSIAWAARGFVPARPAAIARPTTTDQVREILACCAAANVPVTPAAGRSGVCGGTVATFGGLLLDLTGLTGIVDIDETSLVTNVRVGTFGPELEDALRSYGDGYTAGHWPQSMAISTVGGWLACRSAGQYSTRYGKIEDITVGLQAVLASGASVDTRHEAPRSATGPSLTQLFLGSEGALGVITEALLRVHPLPAGRGVRAFGFPTFADGLDACRRIVRRGATPAVLRLYDRAESERNFGITTVCVLVVLDECDPVLLRPTMEVVDQEAAGGHSANAVPGVRMDDALVDRWLEHRNDVSALAPLWNAGVVVDTAEIAGPWSKLPDLAHEVVATLERVPGTIAASVHQSHAYTDGACLYFTFAGHEPDKISHSRAHAEAGDAGGDLQWMERYYLEAWNALTAVLAQRHAAISHHHGIGINRARFVPEALGAGYEVLRSIKKALDPGGILHPGALGLPSSFGPLPWP